MDKRTYFLLAMQQGLFKKKDWIFSAFAITDDRGKKYPYQIVIQDNKYFYRNEDLDTLTPIDNSSAKEPLYGIHEIVKLKKGEIANLTEDEIDTSYKRIFFNWVVLVYPFGNKIPYVNKQISITKIEDIIAPILQDIPKDASQTRDNKFIYVDEYLKFTDAVYYLTGFTQVFVPAATEKAITVDPRVIARRDELLKEAGANITDPAVLARIDAELIALDKEFLKDDESKGFLIDKKAFDVVRKKLFFMVGAEQGFRDTTQADPVLKSLKEGWDMNKFPTMMGILRAGSYNRGAETALGGDQTKWLFRASSNIRVTVDDCGTTTGVPRVITEKNANTFIGRSIIESNKVIQITNENVKSYVGKPVIVRSPMFCKLGLTDYCKTCVGEKLAHHETGLSVAVANYGSVFMTLFMKKMHGVGLAVTKLDLDETLF